MSPKLQRIAIADACGWAVTPFGKPILNHPKTWCTLFDLPDYLNDLNAMHEAELANIDQLDQEYYATLERLCFESRGLNGAGGNLSVGFSGWIAHATAAQRAEAFLRTIGRWEE